MNKTLWRITVTAHREVEDAMAELMEQRWNLSAVRYCSEEGGECSVSVYADRLPDTIRQLRQTVRQAGQLFQSCGLAVGRMHCSIRRIQREDWAESWKRHFKPFTIGQQLLIKPSWSRKQPRPGQSVIQLDPGLSFGTGQHPTTRFCLEHLAKLRKSNCRQSLLDMGTGSGILAIAALKLGYRPVQAFDYDPAAVHTTRQNAQLNQVGKLLPVSRQNLTQMPLNSARQFEVVCANLEYDLLLAESGRIMSRVKPGGYLLLAGILEPQFRSVAQRYQTQGMKLIGSKTEAGWRSGMFVYPIDK